MFRNGKYTEKVPRMSSYSGETVRIQRYKDHYPFACFTGDGRTKLWELPVPGSLPIRRTVWDESRKNLCGIGMTLIPIPGYNVSGNCFPDEIPLLHHKGEVGETREGGNISGAIS